MKRLSEMIESGSWGIRDEMQRIARLQHEYAPLNMGCENWPESVDSYVAKEALRLAVEGKGRKTVELLSSRLSEMKAGGIGPAHPNMLQIVALIDLFTKQQHGKQKGEPGADGNRRKPGSRINHNHDGGAIAPPFGSKK